MMTDATTAKSCEPQPLPEGSPTSKWSLEQLATYAQQKHDAIAEAEKPLAVQYWQLGLALCITREKAKHGKWGQYLKSLGIDKTRASKARAIYKACRTEKEVSGLSVAEAYARRKRKKTQRPQTGPAVMSDKAELREFLKAIRNDAERYYDVAAFLDPPEAPEFLKDVEDTIKKLEKIRDRLRQQAGQ
jgi:hypothetical protein